MVFSTWPVADGGEGVVVRGGGEEEGVGRGKSDPQAKPYDVC